MSTQEEPDLLHFPEPIVIYLNQMGSIPEENILHFSLDGQESFHYLVKNFSYLAHSAEELNHRKMAALIPFQVLRLRQLLRAKNSGKGEPSATKYPDTGNRQKRTNPSTNRNQKEITPNKGNEHKATFDPDKFSQLQDKIRHDIIDSIETNLQMGYLTIDDAKQLYELTGFLDEHIRNEFSHKMKGAKEHMRPLLPGALELPNDKYRLRITELEQENARFADEITRYADDNAKYADEILKLQQRIAELEAKQK